MLIWGGGGDKVSSLYVISISGTPYLKRFLDGSIGNPKGRVLRSFLERSRSASGANLANGSLL